MLNKSITQNNLKDAFEHLYTVISSNKFLSNQGLNNEVPFHICPYQPVAEVQVAQITKQLVNRLAQEGIAVLEINLYDLSIEMLKKEGDWQWLLENESKLDKQEFLEEIQSILDVENAITPAISQKMAESEFNVLFITGVGEVFPYIRSHNILNNLQKEAKEKPTVMFFPGEYKHSLEKGTSLVLFGKLQDDKYYRAFNILDRAI